MRLERTCLICLPMSLLLLLVLFAPSNAAVEEGASANGKKDTYSIELSKLVEETQSALSEIQDEVSVFINAADTSLRTTEQVKKTVSGYIDSLRQLITIFEDDGKLMQKARELRIEYEVRASNLEQLSKDQPQYGEQYLAMASDYNSLVSRVTSLEKSLRVARESGKASMAHLAKQETFMIEVVRHGQAVNAVNALNDVTRTFERAMSNCNQIVIELGEAAKTESITR